jgi:hypothetical protein
MGEMIGAGAEIFDKLEAEPKFLTSWSRSRTKMEWLRNTGNMPKNCLNKKLKSKLKYFPLFL